MPASGVGDIFSFSVSLISNIALLIALTQVHGLLMRRMEQGKLSDWLRHTLLPGLLYGFVVITGMAAPVVLGPLIFDGRSIVLSLAPVFAGPTAGGIAAVMAAAYRWHIGGPGIYMGIGVILESWLLGSIFYSRFPNPENSKHFYLRLAALQWAVHVVMLALTPLLPADIRAETVHRIFLPVLTIYPLGGVLLGSLLVELKLRAAAEVALRASEKKYRELIDSVPGIIDRWTPDGTLTFMNDYGLQFLGYKAEEIIGKPWSNTLVPETDEDGRKLTELPREISANPDAYRINEHTCILKNGQKAWIRWSNVPIYDDNGRITEFLSIGLDMTDRHNLEKEHQQLEQQLLQAQKMEALGVMAGGLAHDLNNMLVPVVGYAEILLMNETLDEESRRSLEEILHSAERARKLIQQLMAFSRRKSLELREIELNDLASSMTAMLRRLVREDIELQIRPADFPVKVMADSGQLEQVLMNLVVNAVDAMPDGGTLTISVGRVLMREPEVSAHGLSHSGAYGLLTVADSGTGISEEHLSKIFDPFFTTKQPGHGTGLGLAMVYSIIRQHEGTVTVQSTQGKGTTFRILIPEHGSDAAVNEAEPSHTEEHSEPNCPPAGIFGKSLVALVAEDEPSVRMMLVTLLTRMGFEVHTSDSPEACLELAMNLATLDLLVTDMLMPRMNGLQLYESITRQHSQIRTLFVSGHVDQIVQPHLLNSPRTAFLGKPFKRQQLEQVLRRLIENS